MRRKWWTVVVLAFLWGCTGSSTPSPTAPDSTTTTAGATSSTAATSTTLAPIDESQVLRVGTSVPFTNLDPADAFTLGDWEILHAVGDGLLRFEPGNGNLVPGTADSLPDVSEDGRRYTFHLDPDATFADGTALRASDYVQQIERVMRLGGRGSDLVSFYVAGVDAPDDSTVVFDLHDDYAFFPTLVTSTAYLAFHPDSFPTDELAPTPEAPIYGTGPWYVETYSETEIVLEANPRYHGEDQRPGRIVLQVYETSGEMADALANDDLDVIWRGVDGDTAESLSDVDDVTVVPVPGGTLHFLTVNHAGDPTDQHQVRQALAELIDRGAVIESTLGGAFEPAFSPIPPGFLGSTESFRDVYGQPDVAQAIELLRDAGYTESDPAEIELAYPPERFGLDIPAALEEIELQIEATGLATVTLTAQPWNTYVGDVVDGTYDLAFLGWLHDFPDPHNYLAPFVLEGGLGGSGQNLAFPELPGLLADAARESDGNERSTLYEEIQDLYAEDVITIPLWREPQFIAYQENISGSDTFATPESLNVGATLQLDYRAIQVTEDE